MKRFVVLLSFLFCGFAFADTINLHWKNYDGTTYADSTCTVDSDLNIPTTPPTKYGYTFTGWKLASYTPIEYLESSGSQYIDTGYSTITNISPRLVLDLSILSTGGWNVIGTGNCGTYGGPNVGTNPSVNFSAGTNHDYDTGIKASAGVRYLYDLDMINATYKVKNVSTQEYLVDRQINASQVTPSCRPSVTLFAYNCRCNGSGVIDPSKAKIYSAKLWDNNVLVRDMIPVLDENNVPCMLDRVEWKFYYNAGSGQFIAGPAL